METTPGRGELIVRPELTLSAIEVITEALPVDPDDGHTLIAVDGNSTCTWGPVEQVAVKIRNALMDAGLLVERDAEDW
jgi:hypothetical protein